MCLQFLSFGGLTCVYHGVHEETLHAWSAGHWALQQVPSMADSLHSDSGSFLSFLSLEKIKTAPAIRRHLPQRNKNTCPSKRLV